MQRDVADLMTARPHLRTSARFTLSEMHAYHEGYYAGLVIALKVLDATVTNYKTVTTTRRAATRQKKRA